MGLCSSGRDIAKIVLEEERKHITIREGPGESGESWTKLIEFPPGRHLRKLDFGSVVHDKFDIEPAVPHSLSSTKSWHFIHFLWFPLTLDGEPFSWDNLGSAERGGYSYQIKFLQKRCELVKKKFYVGKEEDTSNLQPDEYEANVTVHNFARTFDGNLSLKFENNTDILLRVRTGSRLESQIDPHKKKTLRFDTNNDIFFSILALYGGEWVDLPNHQECSFDGASTSYTFSDAHISELEQSILMKSSDLCFGTVE